MVWCLDKGPSDKRTRTNEENRSTGLVRYAELVDAVDQKQKCGDVERCATNVKRTSCGRRLRHIAAREGQGDHAERNIDKEEKGQPANERIIAATVGPAAVETATTRALFAMPRVIKFADKSKEQAQSSRS